MLASFLSISYSVCYLLVTCFRVDCKSRRGWKINKWSKIFSMLQLAINSAIYSKNQILPQNPEPDYLPSVEPRNRNPLKQQEYLPPTLGQEYGTPEVDVSVQGLPTPEQQPIFQISPINGQQYVGPAFNTDLRNLDQTYKQSQVIYDT